MKTQMIKINGVQNFENWLKINPSKIFQIRQKFQNLEKVKKKPKEITLSPLTVTKVWFYKGNKWRLNWFPLQNRHMLSTKYFFTKRSYKTIQQTYPGFLVTLGLGLSFVRDFWCH